MALPGQIVLAVGIDHARRRRQRAADLMVVEHDDVGAGAWRRIDRGGAVGAAIDGDDQLRAASTNSRIASGFGP